MQNKDRIVRKSEKISFLKRLKASLLSQKSALKSDIHFRSEERRVGKECT